MELIEPAVAKSSGLAGQSAIRLFLRLEGAVVAGVGIWLYARSGASWMLFAALILAPDLAFFGYLKSRKFGVYCYNAAHTYLSPAVLFAASFVSGYELAEDVAIVWVVHIAADRLFGYGLK